MVDHRSTRGGGGLTAAPTGRIATRSAGARSTATSTTAAAAADDDVPDVADLALVLASLIARRLPTQKRRVEGSAFLVVRALERDVVQPDGLPPRRREGSRSGKLSVRGPLPSVLPVAVADLEVESTRILYVETLKVLAIVVGHGVEAALRQLRPDLLRVPRLDSPAEGVPDHVPRSASASATPTGGAV